MKQNTADLKQFITNSPFTTNFKTPQTDNIVTI